MAVTFKKIKASAPLSLKDQIGVGSYKDYEVEQLWLENPGMLLFLLDKALIKVAPEVLELIKRLHYYPEKALEFEDIPF